MHRNQDIIPDNIPRHVAIIMDGNGRWAKKRGLPRSMGHKKGSESVRKVIENASEFGIEYLTLFGFSAENWNRPEQEINDLMKLLRHYLRSETAEFHKKNARLSVIGDRGAFDRDIVDLIENAENLTKDNDGIHVTIALNYGGQQDISQATNKIIEEAFVTGNIPDTATIKDKINKYLMSSGVPDPDLLIRTSGEQRISNFLLWQCAYTEMVFVPALWPDFNTQDLLFSLNEYASRDRRFGAIQNSEKSL